jgi:hypothetical protein
MEATRRTHYRRVRPPSWSLAHLSGKVATVFPVCFVDGSHTSKCADVVRVASVVDLRPGRHSKGVPG